MGKKPREKIRKTMSEKITDWKNEAFYYATHETDGNFNYLYDDIIQSDSMFQTRYSADFVKKLVMKFGYEYVEMMVEHDADDMDKLNARKAEEDAKKAHDILHADDKLNDIIDRAEEENDAE
jgi:hypothetical protein